MKDKKLQLLLQVKEIFMRFGVKSVTMDDIAHHLGISKKTLYKHVHDKTDLVNKVMSSVHHYNRDQIQSICLLDGNAIDQNYRISKHAIAQLQNIHPSVFFDLEKYYPEAWKSMEIMKKDMIYNCVIENIEKGKKEGLYRADVKTILVAKFYLGMMNTLFELFSKPMDPDLSVKELYLELFRYHIRGIASDKGREYLKEKIKKENY